MYHNHILKKQIYELSILTLSKILDHKTILEELSRSRANEWLIRTVRYVMEKGIGMGNETV